MTSDRLLNTTAKDRGADATVAFTEMQHGTPADYELLDGFERQHAVWDTRGLIRPYLPRDAVQIGQDLDVLGTVELVKIDVTEIWNAGN